MKTSKQRCDGCGKPLLADSTQVEITRKAGGRKTTVGRMHVGCYASLTHEPADFFAALEERERALLAKAG